MTYKSKLNYKDLIDKPNHKPGMTRREMIWRGLATGAMTVAAHDMLLGGFMSRAHAAALATCPTPLRNPGAIAQIYAEGGPTMGARFISENQAAMMNANMAANYGISGQANLVKLGPNMVVDSTSPFGFTLLQGPPGYVGGPAAWRTNVLSKISGGAHLGPFSADDGGGSNTGLLGGVSPFKASTMGKDLQIGFQNTPATWAKGMPAATFRNNPTPANLATSFSLTPAANGLTNSAALNAASDASNALSAALAPVFKTNERKGNAEMNQTAGCAFYGNTALADPNYGSTLFNPANIPALTSKLAVAQLTPAEQAQLAGFYQSASGVAGGVVIQFGGRDYHNQSVQNDITPKDIEDARAIVMFLAGCEVAQAPGAMIYLSNGQAIAEGVQAVTATINGTAVNLQGPVAQGDAGGAYNAGLIIFYDPKGAPPQARFTGTVDQNGNAKISPAVGSSQEAVAGLYLSALSWIGGGTVPQAAITKMQAAGVAGTPTKAMVI